MNDNIKKEISALLYNFWITKDENPELYYKIKYNQEKIKDFVVKNLGSNLIIHDRFIKLEKIPSILKSNMGIENFTNVLDYVILSIFLLYLEDKTRGDRFILSSLIDYIKNTAITLELNHIPDWNKVSDRRSLINVINFLKELSVIKVKDEDKISFAESKDSDALYEVMGISNYVMRMFDNDISNISKPLDFLKNEFLTQDEDKGDVRRYRVFRNILFTPSVLMKDLVDSDIDYIKKNRIYIKNEISKNIDMDVEITYNMAITFDEDNNSWKDNFPNSKKITEIVLMVNAKIIEDIRDNRLLLDEYETVTVKESYLEKVIKDIKEEKTPYIGKTYQGFTNDKFYIEVLKYMQSYNLVDKTGDDIIIYPTIGRMIGKTLEIVDDKNEQLNLFGGNNE